MWPGAWKRGGGNGNPPCNIEGDIAGEWDGEGDEDGECIGNVAAGPWGLEGNRRIEIGSRGASTLLALAGARGGVARGPCGPCGPLG